MIENKPDILTRISESDIAEWLIAKLLDTRVSGLPMHTMSVNVAIHSMTHPYTYWGAHASGKCVTSEKTAEEAITNLTTEVMGNPLKDAMERRRQAQDLLQEAVELEKLALAKKGAA